jgi:two-component system, OmpR family, sensor histidine kinase VicK
MLVLTPTDYFNSHSIPEMTRVINGSENVMAAISQFLSDTKNVIYSCGDYRGPSIAIEVQEYRKLIPKLRSRGINLKYITEITSKNIHYCKELMKLGYEIRHLDGIKANFSINETEYVASTTAEESQPIPQVIYSNIKDIVIQQKYVFDSFWNKAVPAEQKIREIEENIEPEIFETITDHEIASQILIDLAKSVKKEALFLLPNDKSMVRIDKLGIVDYLVKASQESDSIIIRIICPLSDENSEILKKIIENAPRIKVVNGTDSPYGMYVVDNERAFRVELKEPSAKTFSEAIGFAVYSNRQSTVEFFKSVFELLWKERVLNEELKRADTMQKEFINIAAHELKTPTQAILGFSGLLKHYPERRDEVIEVISRNAARLQTLITNILDVTKIESQNLKLNIETFSISDLISAIVEDYKEGIKSKKTNLELVYNYKDNNHPILVEADKERIIQVISNLLSNSLQFTKEGHITIDVGLAIDDKKSREVIVTVSDTGSGMDPEIMPRLFTRFASKSFQGTGLGLYISKSIIEAHGGKIWSGKNQDGKGARISFTLPVKINGQVRKEKEEPRS